jgi:hypothetical protein
MNGLKKYNAKSCKKVLCEQFPLVFVVLFVYTIAVIFKLRFTLGAGTDGYYK